MRRSRLIAGLTGSLALAALAATVIAPATQAAPMGTRSLATVLGVNPSAAPTFDHNWSDYDILTDTINAILKAKPDSPVGTLANGKVAATCFIPTDSAFRKFAIQAFPKAHGYPTEKSVFTALATKTPGGINTLEAIVLYHCTAGTIDSSAASKANNVVLRMFNGGAVRVKVMNGRIYLYDKGLLYTNPWVVQADINKGNKQIAHGISRVLLPANLPSPIAG
ncbi:MAG: fasciclin domain-containing protein [Actinomycetes bacterium]